MLRCHNFSLYILTLYIEIIYLVEEFPSTYSYSQEENMTVGKGVDVDRGIETYLQTEAKDPLHAAIKAAILGGKVAADPIKERRSMLIHLLNFALGEEFQRLWDLDFLREAEFRGMQQTFH